MNESSTLAILHSGLRIWAWLEREGMQVVCAVGRSFGWWRTMKELQLQQRQQLWHHFFGKGESIILNKEMGCNKSKKCQSVTMAYCHWLQYEYEQPQYNDVVLHDFFELMRGRCEVWGLRERSWTVVKHESSGKYRWTPVLLGFIQTYFSRTWVEST